MNLGVNPAATLRPHTGRRLTGEIHPILAPAHSVGQFYLDYAASVFHHDRADRIEARAGQGPVRMVSNGIETHTPSGLPPAHLMACDHACLRWRNTGSWTGVAT